MRKYLLALLLFAAPVSAQVSIPNVLTAGTTISAAGLNTNFSALGNDSLDRTGGAITGAITVDAGVTIDGADISAYLAGGKLLASSTAADSLDVEGGITAGSGGVAIVDTTGKIPAISSTYFASLSGANLTGVIAAAADITGIIPAAVASEANEVKFYEASCPAGFTDLSATYGGRYVVIVPTGGDIGAAALVGTALTTEENRATGVHGHTLVMNSHNHTQDAHFHTEEGVSWTLAGEAGSNEAGNFGGPTQNTSSTVATNQAATSTGTVSNSAGVAGTNAPYVQLHACRKT